MHKTLPSALLALFLAACGGENLTPPAHGDYQAPGTGALECVPNLDGRIEASELSVALGVPMNLLVPPAGVTRAVDLAGTLDEDGHRLWDWGADYADDQLARVAAAPLAGRWYAPSFPAGEFVVPFDLGGSVEAIYSKDSASMRLHGLASALPDPAEGRTLLVYDQPIVVFRFPIEPGAEWRSTGTVRGGVVRGIPYAARDTYDVRVDGAGRLVLPDLLFTQAHRVRTTVTVEPAVGAPVVQRQVSFLFECFGEVARATSLPGETEDDFTTAAELRRLGL